MVLDKSGKLIADLDFRGTKIEFLDKISAKDLLIINASVLQLVNRKETFKATDLAPKTWDNTVYQSLYNACQDKAGALRLFGVIVKQALIMSPLLFRQEDSDSDWEATTYTRL